MDPKKTEKVFKGKRKPREEVKRGKVSKFVEKSGKTAQKEEPVYKKGPNDPAWRTADAVMTKLVANIPFGLAAGLSQDVESGVDASNNPTSIAYRQPGVMVTQVELMMGNATDYNAALNLAVRKIYSFVRHANSGSRNYEAADMGIYFGALMQVLGVLGWLQRVRRTLNEFSTTNRYTPRTLMQAQGLDADDFLKHQPQLAWLIAWLGRAVGSLAFPDMPIFRAAYECFKHIYVDNDSPKEQYYLINPYDFAKYNPTYDANGGGINYTSRITSPITSFAPGANNSYDDVQTYVLDLIDSILGDEDCGIISGDILKAFPNDSGLFRPEAFGEDYDLFLHSPEILQQIHNMSIIGSDVYVDGYHQAPGGTGTAPYIIHDINANSASSLSTGTCFAQNLMVDAFSRQPDAIEVVNCITLQPHVKVAYAGGNTFRINTSTLVFDLIMPRSAYIYYTLAAGPVNITADIMRYGNNVSLTGPQIPVSFSYLTNFDWHPITPKVYSGTLYIVGDIQNISFNTYEVAKRIHDNSMLSLLGFQEHNFLS